MPSEELADPSSRAFLSFVRESFPDFVPTTYETAKAFIDKELLKPEGQRDLRRAICLLMVVKIPDIVFKSEKLLVELKQGEIFWSAR
jgi:hypothetical protein